MYRFKIEKKEEYLDGRKIGYIADKIGIAREYLTSILTGNRTCSKIVAFCIVKVLYQEKEIDDFFENVKE